MKAKGQKKKKQKILVVRPKKNRNKKSLSKIQISSAINQKISKSPLSKQIKNKNMFNNSMKMFLMNQNSKSPKKSANKNMKNNLKKTKRKKLKIMICSSMRIQAK